MGLTRGVNHPFFSVDICDGLGLRVAVSGKQFSQFFMIIFERLGENLSVRDQAVLSDLRQCVVEQQRLVIGHEQCAVRFVRHHIEVHGAP